MGNQLWKKVGMLCHLLICSRQWALKTCPHFLMNRFLLKMDWNTWILRKYLIVKIAPVTSIILSTLHQNKTQMNPWMRALSRISVVRTYINQTSRSTHSCRSTWSIPSACDRIALQKFKAVLSIIHMNSLEVATLKKTTTGKLWASGLHYHTKCQVLAARSWTCWKAAAATVAKSKIKCPVVTIQKICLF